VSSGTQAATAAVRATAGSGTVAPGTAGPAAPGPGAAAQPEVDVARLRVAILRMSRRLRKHELAGLTPSQLSTLASVAKTGPVRLGDLAATERIAPSTLTRLVSVLEERQYVQRRPVPGDARASMVVVTPPGTEVLDRIRQETTSLLTEIVLGLSAEEQQALARALPALEQLAGAG
jgi:DNA-binding MarR family transcriptional regulator